MKGIQPATVAPPKAATVIPLQGKAKRPASAKPTPRGVANWARKNWIAASAIAFVLMPLLVVTFYLGLLASDRFSVEVKLAVRSQETPAVDALGVFSSFGGGGGTASDSYILIDYLLGRGMVEEMTRTVDVRRMYSNSSVDWISRLDATRPIEEIVEYWQKMVTASFEPATGIVRIEVTAYDREETVKLANAVVAAADGLVNRLSAESRHDALKAATTELERAEQRQRLIRAAMRKFREQEQIADPIRRAGAQQEMIEKAKGELQRIETELQTARGFMKDDAPSIVVLKNQRAAMLKQIDELQKEVGVEGSASGEAGKAGGRRAVASMLATYEELEAERQFAEKAYLSALASLERARYDADRKQRFLAVFEKPGTPEEAKYPRTLRDITVAFLAFGLLWGLGVFIVFGIREHT